MNSFIKYLAVAVSAMLFTGAACAKTVQEYHWLASQDQSEYEWGMIVGAKKICRAASRADQAVKITELFTTNAPGATVALGEAELDVGEGLALVEVANGASLDVEDVMAAILEQHGIFMPPSFFSVMSEFRPAHPAQARDSRGGTLKKEAADWLQAATEVIGKAGVKLPAGFSDLMKEYKRGVVPANLGPTDEQAVLRHLIMDVRANGFADLRGSKVGDNPEWRSVTSAVGALACNVDWRDNATNQTELECTMLDEASQAEARREFLRVRDLVASVVPWRDARHAPPAEDNFRIFFVPHPEGQPSRGSIVVRFDPDDQPGKYYVQLRISSALSPAKAREFAEKQKSDMAGWVADDVREYIAAGAKGFESYKQGEPKIGTTGGRWWDCAVHPFLAEDCIIRQPPGETTAFMIFLRSSLYPGEMEVQFRELALDVEAALPDGWRAAVKPPFVDAIASEEFVSSNGMSGQIWVAFDKGRFQLNTQIMSGPR